MFCRSKPDAAFADLAKSCQLFLQKNQAQEVVYYAENMQEMTQRRLHNDGSDLWVFEEFSSWIEEEFEEVEANEQAQQSAESYEKNYLLYPSHYYGNPS